jgi:hypothetical protein
MVAAAAVIILIGVAVATRPRSGPPASVRLERNALIVLDGRGRELWRQLFPYSLHEAAYPDRASWFTWIGDLDGDGHNEVLFAPHSLAGTQVSTPLICYSDRGVERWRFTSQQNVRTVSEAFAPTYGIARFLVTSLGKGQPNAILVTSTHALYYPCRVALLTPGGRVLREYWHSGHLNFLQSADLDGDGKTEFYLAGISNAWHSATLVVLDLDHFGGASQEPQALDYQMQGFPAGSERSRVILPRSCLNTAFDPYNTIYDFTVRPGEIMVHTAELISPVGAGIIHHLSPDFRQHRVVLSDSYKIAHRSALLAGQLNHCTIDDGAPQTLRIIGAARR